MQKHKEKEKYENVNTSQPWVQVAHDSNKIPNLTKPQSLNNTNNPNPNTLNDQN